MLSSIIVALTNVKPDDIELAVILTADTRENDSALSNEHVYAPNNDKQIFVDAEIYELPGDIRMRRKINEKYSSEDEFGSQDAIESNERSVDEPTKIPLQGLIMAIETDLVATALLANTQLRKRQSMAHEVSNTKSNIENQTIHAANDSIDVNKNLFENLFNFTRSDQQSDVKIPLHGLVTAVETTLINSAQNLRGTDQLAPNIDAAAMMNSNATKAHRIDRDTNHGIVQVQTLNGMNSMQNLNLLSPIIFKPIQNETEINIDDDDGDMNCTIDCASIQETNFTVIHSSDTVRLIPDDENKLAHVQHQAISKTVFQSNLAIFPTIASLSTNTSALTSTSMEEMNENSTATTVATITTQQSSPLNSTNGLLQKLAEVQAQPVIFSQFP